MINVNDLAEIIRPVWPTIRAVLAWQAGRRLAARQHGCNRCKEIAPMKTGRKALRFPVNIPTVRLSGTALDQLKQAVAGTDIPPAIGLNDNGGAGFTPPQRAQH